MNLSRENNYHILLPLIADKIIDIIEINPKLFISDKYLKDTIIKINTFSLLLSNASKNSVGKIKYQLLEASRSLLAKASKIGFLELINLYALKYLRNTDDLIENFTSVEFIRYLNDAIENYKGDLNNIELSDTYYNLGKLYLSLNKNNQQHFNEEKMIAAFQKAIDRGDGDAAHALGIYFLSNKSYDEAIHHLKLAEGRGCIASIISLSVAEILSKKATHETLERLLSYINSDNNLKYLNNAYALISLYHTEYTKNPEEALVYLEKINFSLLSVLEKIKLLRTKGMTELKLNRFGRARYTFQQLAQPELHYPKAHLYLAIVALKESRSSEIWAQLHQAEQAGLKNPFGLFKKIAYEDEPKSLGTAMVTESNYKSPQPNKDTKQQESESAVRNKDLKKLKILLDPSNSAQLSPHKFDSLLQRVIVKMLGGSIKKSGVRTVIALPGAHTKSADKTGLHLPHAGQNQVGTGRASDISTFLNERPEVKKILRGRRK